MRNKKERSTKVIRAVCIAILIGLVLPLISCVSIGIGWRGSVDDCVSITLFENHHILTVTRMVLRHDGKSDIEIVNPILIRRVTAATTTANRTNRNHCVGPATTIDLYSGKRLIRSMEWAPHDNVVEVCDEPDSTHILIQREITSSPKGFVKLPAALRDRLNGIIEEEWGYIPY